MTHVGKSDNRFKTGGFKKDGKDTKVFQAKDDSRTKSRGSGEEKGNKNSRLNGPDRDGFTRNSNLFELSAEREFEPDKDDKDDKEIKKKDRKDRAGDTEQSESESRREGEDSGKARRQEKSPFSTSPSSSSLPAQTAGAGGPITMERLLQAAGGNQQIADTLARLLQDPEAAEALRIALDKGTTFKVGELPGSTVGRAERSRNGNVITLEDPTNIDTAAHEVAHIAYPDMPHPEVYEFGHRVARNLGARVNNNGRVPAGIT